VPVLPTVDVQVLAALVILATAADWVLIRPRGLRVQAPRSVIARKSTPPWVDGAWIGGNLAVVSWSLAVLLLPAYAYDWPRISDQPFLGALQAIGFALALVGGVLFFTSVRALGRHMTVAIQVQEGHRLVREGPYRFVRHPAYTGLLTSSVGLSLLYLSPILAGLTLVIIALAMYRSTLEERLLRSPEGFGSAYDEYVSETGRFLPRFLRRKH